MQTQFKTAHIIVLMAILIFTSSVQPAQAIPVGVIANAVQLPFDIKSTIEETLIDIAVTAKWVLGILERLQNSVLDPLAWAVAKSQIHQESNTILSQVRGGGNARGETKGPLFVTDWEKVSKTAVSNQRKFFLQELAVTKKVDPAFQETLLSSFSGNPNKSVFNRLQSSFANDTGCSDEPGQSCMEGFLGDFSKGGWAGWNSAITKSGNNPYLSYLVLQEEKAKREETVAEARKNEALASGGALGTQDCVDEPTAEGEGNDGSPTLQKCKVTRPGATVSTDLSKVLGGNIDTLQNADEFSELILGAFANLIGSLRSKGIKSDNEERDLISDSREAVTRTNLAQSEKTINDLQKSVTRSLGELAQIWEVKVKTLDLIDEVPPGLIYEINQTQLNVDTNGSCADKPDVYEQLPDSLANAQEQMDKLWNEVGFPVDFANPSNGTPDLGYYENGGLYSENLFKEQSNLEYLKAVIENPDVEPSIIPYDEDVASIFKEPPRLTSDEKLRTAQQLVGVEVGRVSELLTQIGTVAGAKAEQQGVNQRMLSQRQATRTCSLQ